MTFRLLPDYPNPFNPTTTIEFHLPRTAQVPLVVFDVNGSAVATLLSGEKLEAGIHKLEFDASFLPSDAYVRRLKANGFEKAIKMTLLK